MSMDGQGTKCRRKIAQIYNRLSRVHKRYRQADRQTDDRQTDGRATAISERELAIAYCRPSVVYHLSVGNARAPYSGSYNFRKSFYGVWYLGHPLTFTENFTEIIPGEPLRRGS